MCTVCGCGDGEVETEQGHAHSHDHGHSHHYGQGPAHAPDLSQSRMVLTETDLLPHLDFNVHQCIPDARRMNPRVRVPLVPAKSGEGQNDCYTWVKASCDMARISRLTLQEVG